MPSVNTCLQYYLTHHVQHKVVDKARIRHCIKPLNRALGRREVDTLTPRDCREYEQKRTNKGIKPGTIRRELGCLASALAYCKRDNVIPAVPHLYLPKRPPGRDIWLTEEDAERLIACAGQRAKLFIQIGLATGGRPEAIDSLLWSQVDLLRRTIDFNTPGRPQTAKRRPVVPISDKLYPVLFDASMSATTMYVLGSNASTRKCFDSARKKSGLLNVTRKTLRHTWATWAAQRGVDLWKIAGVLGDTVETVERVYAHHHPQYLKDAVNF